MHAVGQQDHENLTVRIDPERRARKTGVTERPRTEIVAASGTTVARIPAKSAMSSGATREERDGTVGDDAHAVVGATFEQHLRKHRQVGRRAEQTGVTGDAAERPGVFVVHFPTQRVAARWGDFGRRGARDIVQRQAVMRVVHAEL